MASSKLQLPADDSVLLLVTHSNLSTFAADIRVSKQVPSFVTLDWIPSPPLPEAGISDLVG